MATSREEGKCGELLNYNSQRGFKLHGEKRNVLDVSGVLYNCIFLAPNKEPAAESGLFWTTFKKLKQRLKKKKEQRSVCLPSTDRWLYLCS